MKKKIIKCKKCNEMQFACSCMCRLANPETKTKKGGKK